MAKPDTKDENEHQHDETSDPVLLILGVGKQLWVLEPGDSFVERLRSDDARPLTPFEEQLDIPAQF